jgi:hypothetical protein
MNRNRPEFGFPQPAKEEKPRPAGPLSLVDEKAKPKTGGAYDPYARDVAEPHQVKQKPRDLRALSEWIKTKKAVEELKTGKPDDTDASD